MILNQTLITENEMSELSLFLCYELPIILFNLILNGCILACRVS